MYHPKSVKFTAERSAARTVGPRLLRGLEHHLLLQWRLAERSRLVALLRWDCRPVWGCPILIVNSSFRGPGSYLYPQHD